MAELPLRKSQRRHKIQARIVFHSDGHFKCISDLHKLVPDESKHQEGSVVYIDWGGKTEAVTIRKIGGTVSELDNSDMTSDDNAPALVTSINSTNKGCGNIKIKKAKANPDPNKIADMESIFFVPDSILSQSASCKQKVNIKSVPPKGIETTISSNDKKLLNKKISSQTFRKPCRPSLTVAKKASHPLAVAINRPVGPPKAAAQPIGHPSIAVTKKQGLPPLSVAINLPVGQPASASKTISGPATAAAKKSGRSPVSAAKTAGCPLAKANNSPVSQPLAVAKTAGRPATAAANKPCRPPLSAAKTAGRPLAKARNSPVSPPVAVAKTAGRPATAAPNKPCRPPLSAAKTAGRPLTKASNSPVSPPLAVAKTAGRPATAAANKPGCPPISVKKKECQPLVEATNSIVQLDVAGIYKPGCSSQTVGNAIPCPFNITNAVTVTNDIRTNTITNQKDPSPFGKIVSTPQNVKRAETPTYISTLHPSLKGECLKNCSNPAIEQKLNKNRASVPVPKIQVSQAQTEPLEIMPESPIGSLSEVESISEPLTPDPEPLTSEPESPEKLDPYIWSPLKSLNDEIKSKDTLEEKACCIRNLADKISPSMKGVQVEIEVGSGEYISAADKEDAILKAQSSNQLARLLLCHRFGEDFIVNNPGRSVAQKKIGRVFKAIQGLCFRIYHENPCGLGKRKSSKKGSFIMLYNQLATQIRKKRKRAAEEPKCIQPKKIKKTTQQDQVEGDFAEEAGAAGVMELVAEEGVAGDSEESGIVGENITEIVDSSSDLSSFEDLEEMRRNRKSRKQLSFIDEDRLSSNDEKEIVESNSSTENEVEGPIIMTNYNMENEFENGSLSFDTQSEPRDNMVTVDGSALRPQDCQLPAYQPFTSTSNNFTSKPCDPVQYSISETNMCPSESSSNVYYDGDKNLTPAPYTPHDRSRNSLLEIGSNTVNSCTYLSPACSMPPVGNLQPEFTTAVGSYLQMLQPISTYGPFNITPSPLYPAADPPTFAIENLICDNSSYATFGNSHQYAGNDEYRMSWEHY